MTDSTLSACSVVIPTYNRLDRVCQAVTSVLLGRLPAAEVLVIDDGSQDGTAQVLATRGAPVRVIRLERNGGVARARNLGIRLAVHPWIALLDSDDRWLEEHLECLVKHLAACPDRRVVQCRERWFRRGARVAARKHQQPRSGDLYLPSLELCLVSSSAALVHRDLFFEVGLYDERLPVCEDYDLWLRMATKTSFGLVDRETVVKDGPREDQLSRRFWGMDRFRVFALVKLLSSHLPERWAPQTRQVALRKLEVLAGGAAKRDNPLAVKAYHRWMEAIRQGEGGCHGDPDGNTTRLPALLENAGFTWEERASDPILSALLEPQPEPVWSVVAESR
ncbi:MAG: glycosyltransferase family 2 protein [Bradymonadales bacterium]|nr:glycosyltransferase family 2 protein [Bradymonadales bacterium]